MKARARIVAEADGAGGTRLVVLRGEAPLLPRRTGSGPGPATVHLVGGAAGPLRGDDLLVEIEVGPGARLRVRTVAASIVLGGRCPEPSRSTVVASVADGGELSWLPEPVIATAGCDHTMEANVELDAGARSTWREELIGGRSGEEPGDLRLVTAIRYGGRALSTQELAVGPRAPGWRGPAVLGHFRAAGTVLLAGADVALAGTGGDTVGGTAQGWVLKLAGPGVLVSAVAPDAHTLRCALDRLSARPGAGYQAATAHSSG